MYEPRSVRRRLNAFHHVAHAPSPITAAVARAVPDGVSAATVLPIPNLVTVVCSKIRTPSSISRRRNPRARRAGWRVAASAISRPPPNRGEAHRFRTSSADSTRYSSSTPSALAASSCPSHPPSCLGLVATARSPPWRNHASTPFALHQVPISVGERPHVISSSIASASPYTSRTSRIFSHHPSQKPPLRPLGPPPQMSPSSSTTSRSGLRSFRNHAVHIPV